MVLTGRRLTPSGRASLLVNMRRRMASASSANSSPGSCARSHTMISFLLVGCCASGHATIRQPRSTGTCPVMCRKGRGALRPTCAAACSFLRRSRQKSNRRGLLLADQARQRHRGAHVGQRIVRGFVRQAIGRAQQFEPEAHPSLFVGRPHDAVRPQRVGGAHQIEDVPAPAVVLPFARIGIDQVAPEQETGELVVEADGVVADADGAGLAEGLLDVARELVLGHPLRQALLRGDAGDQAGLRVGQVIRRGLAILHQRRADFVQLGVGADRGELRRAIAARADAEGFVVVPEKAAHGLKAWRCARRPPPESARSRNACPSRRNAPPARCRGDRRRVSAWCAKRCAGARLRRNSSHLPAT